ncbi:MAG TPA: GMC family oxidoreductase [Bauldia sp.]|nr:GMC family oxidoreductase [Bauldia sp.]
MIVDAAADGPEALTDRLFDVCIAGSGPAGITLARRLAAKGADVVLLEGGGLDENDQSQSLYQGSIVGRPYFPLDVCRLRYFGGTSNHWGGWSRPLDAHDFEANPANPMSGWPIAKSDLDPYAAETDATLDLPGLPSKAPDIFGGTLADYVPISFRFSPPTHFGDKYRGELTASTAITTAVNTNLVDVRLDPGDRFVNEALFKTYGRPDAFSVRARFYVLALGGIENARMLLNANGQRPQGIGNEYDLVGRYFMEHLTFPVGAMLLRQPEYEMVIYSPSPELMAREQILNFGLRLTPIQIQAADDPNPVNPACADPLSDLIAADLAGTTIWCPGRGGNVFMAAEQALNRDSRVLLVADVDPFGLRRAALDWRLSDTDFRTLDTAIIGLAAEMAKSDIGRMKIDAWFLRHSRTNPAGEHIEGGNHHMGTTRMSDDPKTGVVTRDGRLHSVENLYLAGSSVFASSGHANPTYTIVQLALRLGDHLTDRLKAG